jgi:hypothetical protein
MRKLRIAIIDLVAKDTAHTLYGRLMHANLASIMPQIIAVWCEEKGHDVTLVCFMGHEDLKRMIPPDVDLVIIGAFTHAAQMAYAMSNLFRSRGAVTALGGPHARCYPEDAKQYFDYVLGFTDEAVVDDLLRDCSPHRPTGLGLSAGKQPAALPGVRRRWKYIQPILRRAPLLKIVPMIGSLGCPYRCNFCIDSEVPYQPLDLETIKEDLRFLRTKLRRPKVGWHDPNFGVRFDEFMDAIGEAVPPGSVNFIAESSLSILSEPRLRRLRRNGFVGILPGIESWYDLGAKSKTRQLVGMDKVRKVSEHVNMILRYLPYVHSNFVLGLDADEGPEPFELTKRFVDLVPGTFLAFSQLTAFGRAAPLNLEFQRTGRVLPFPFHFLNNNHAMNVRPKHYSWPRFYDHLIDLTRHTFSRRAILRRFQANRGFISRGMNVVRAISSEGFGRIRYHTEVRRRLESDRPMRRYFEGETTALPSFFLDRVREDLGPLWTWLPRGALYHDQNAYLKAEQGRLQAPEELSVVIEKEESAAAAVAMAG